MVGSGVSAKIGFCSGANKIKTVFFLKISENLTSVIGNKRKDNSVA